MENKSEDKAVVKAPVKKNAFRWLTYVVAIFVIILSVLIVKNERFITSAGRFTGFKSSNVENSATGSSQATAADWIKKALELRKGEKYSDPAAAVEYLSRAVDLQPDNFRAYIARGFAYIELEYFSYAIDDFSKAINIKPDVYAYNGRGLAYARLGDYTLALDDFNNAIRFKPDYAAAYNNRGFAYAGLSQYKKAIKDLNEAIRLRPDFADAYNDLAGVYLIQGKNETGCRYARKACAMGSCKALKMAGSEGNCL